MFLLILIFSILFSSDNSNKTESLAITNTEQTSSFASMKFHDKYIISDTLCEGKSYKFIYKFTNVGNTPLIISSVRSSCGCYVPQWPKEPIVPGDSSQIVGTYNTKYKPGVFNRSLTVISNDSLQPRTVLSVRGFTLPRDSCQN